MKKFLALVLALVMTMSLVTISAGAEDYTDDSNIDYAEAVEVVSALGIVGGYADGSFNPDGTLTRGAAAKIICNLILGTTTASALTADAAPYSDVPANHTFAGYIAYCQSEGIISGYADGTFRPAATLTGYAFMKMLLGCLGYDATLESYVGSNWSVNVAKRALSIGLDAGLVDEFNGAKPLTRQEAALFTLNTLKANVVSYADKGTNITIGGTTINTGASDAEPMDQTGYTNNMNKAGLQFAEKHFSKLVRTPGTDDFGRPATTWLYKGEKIGQYASNPTLTYAKSVKLSEIYKDLGMSTAASTTQIYVNSNVVDNYDDTVNTTWNVSKGNTGKLKDYNGNIKNGTIVEVYLDTDDNSVDICAMSVYVGEIGKVKDATATKDAYVVVNEIGNEPATFDAAGNDEFETTAFAEDEIVAYTYSDSAQAIKTLTKLDYVEGTLSERLMGTSLTLGGNEYKYSKNVAFDGITEATMANKGEYRAYLDTNGYVILVAETAAVIEDFALVTSIRSEASWNNNQAKLVFADGTTKTVNLAKDYYTNGIEAGSIVVAKENDDGDYKLTSKVAGTDGQTWATADGAFTMSNTNASVTFGGGTKYANSKTVFVVKNGTNGDWKVFTGIKNAPNISTDAGNLVASYCKSGSTLSVVFVYSPASTVVGGSKDVTFIAGNSRSDKIVDIDDNEYYRYNAVVGGKITTVLVDADGAGLNQASGLKVNDIYNTVVLDGDGLIVSANFTDAGSVTHGNGIGVKKMSGEYSIAVDTQGANATLTVADNAVIYIADGDGVFEAAELSDIRTDDTDEVFWVLDDGEITNLFVVEVAG